MTVKGPQCVPQLNADRSIATVPHHLTRLSIAAVKNDAANIAKQIALRKPAY